MNIKCFFILLICCVNLSAAEEQSKILKKVKDQLRKHSQIQGSFKQIKAIVDPKVELESSGTFTYKMPLSLEWRQKEPFLLTLLMTPDSIVQRNENGNEQKMSKADYPVVFSLSSVVLKVFSGREKDIDENFSYTVDYLKKGWFLDLKPKDKILKKIILRLQLSGSEFIDQVLITEVTGNSTSIRFEKVTDI